jgi:asparagine N-glycosylation enzyme membrane subunit Stt3
MQLKLTAAVAALLVVVFFALFVGSCEARRLRALGRVSSLKPSSSPPTPYKVGAVEGITWYISEYKVFLFFGCSNFSMLLPCAGCGKHEASWF